jgi:hypothetical protein
MEGGRAQGLPLRAVDFYVGYRRPAEKDIAASGLCVEEWPEAPKGGAREIEALCDRVRAQLVASVLESG